MPDILLATLNAKYAHSSLGLRYLLANLGDLRPRAALLEFTWDQRPADIAERLLAAEPRVIGLGVYLWNARESLHLAQILKAVAPQAWLVLGGPEVSHETAGQPIVALADYVIAGPGDLAFAELCRRLLAGEPPPERLIQAPPPPLERLALPYAEYDAEDIAHRLVYVEASRGCPFHCEFCLSALDRTAWPFPLDPVLAALDDLYARGLRHFKFVDRTFNLDPRQARRILEFFLGRLDERLFLHFEVLPDRLPEALREPLTRFPPGCLQLEVGVQTFNPEVQARIHRRQDLARTEANLRWLRAHTQAHLHADLLLGLPGEDLASFAAGFNRLWALGPHEIQVGILKRLRGAPITRHEAAFGMRFDPQPPYALLGNRDLDFPSLQRLGRFARYWDLIGNSGRFAHTLPRLLGTDPFGRFLAIADWLFARTGQTHRFALARLFELLREGLEQVLALPAAEARESLARDWARANQKDRPPDLEVSPRRQARHRLGDDPA